MAGPRKHVPLRTCASCGTKTGKRELTRIVASPQGAIEVDTTGKLPGRGAYVCVQCAAGDLGKGRIEYALRTGLSDTRWARVRSSIQVVATRE